MFEDDAYKWLNDNATMYRGNNASDCMVAAFIAGAKLVEEKFTSTNKAMDAIALAKKHGMLYPSGSAARQQMLDHAQWIIAQRPSLD